MENHIPKVVPYTFRKAVFMHKFVDGVELKGYYVKLWFVFDGKHTQSFAHVSDAIDYACLAREIGVSVEMFDKEILVTSVLFTSIFNEIESYVSDSG